MPGCSVEAITPDGPDLLHVDARGTRPGGHCPDCGGASHAVHSRYRRHPADLPSIGCRVQVELQVRRFYCRSAKCARRTFSERLPELVALYARRTTRLALRWLRHRLLRRRIARAMAQGQVGAALGGKVAARLLNHLAMPASYDTVLHPIRGLPLPASASPRVVGVDNWALRKGRTYSTIVVDLDVRRRHLAGEALLAIGRATGLARATVRKYAHAKSFPERAVRRPSGSILDPFIAHLETRMAPSGSSATGCFADGSKGRWLRGRNGTLA